MRGLTELRGYALALVLCTIAVPCAISFDIPSSSFLLAAMASCIFGGRQPGIFTIVFLAIAFDISFLAPKHQLILGADSVVRFLSFVSAMLSATTRAGRRLSGWRTRTILRDRIIVMAILKSSRTHKPETRRFVRRSFSASLPLLAVTAVILLLDPTQIHAQAPPLAIGRTLPQEPEAHSPLILSAVTDSEGGRNTFFFGNSAEPPVIRSQPGSQIRIELRNEMTSHSTEVCVDGPCRNMTNLHFHGLHVSPVAPQDDVISMMAMPGETLRYMVDIPFNQPPGLYWYHTHPHGESYQQSLDGMSGAIVIEGLEKYFPKITGLKEQILVLRDFDLTRAPKDAEKIRKAVDISDRSCGRATGAPMRVFTVNRVIRPKIPIAPGESQLWRIVNASPDLYADLEIDAAFMQVVAVDGMPLSFHDPGRRPEQVQHFLLPPAGRVEAIVTAPHSGIRTILRSNCVNTGPDGDPNPAMAIADLDENKGSPESSKSPSLPSKTIGRSFPVPKHILQTVETNKPDFLVKFSEDKHGFYINERKYGPDDPPMAVVQTGSYRHWKVQNDTGEIHPFHIHQVHFLVYASDGKPVPDPIWRDTVNVPSHGSVDLVMDFTDPIIKGMSLFHCHLLKHEDKGMMAKILFQ